MLCTKHAEIIAIEKASKKLKNWRLENCSIYVTLEPCLMCTGTLISSRIKNVYYGVKDKKLGSIESKIKISDFNYYHKMNIIGGILKDDCKKLILDFFQKLRKEKKVNKNGRII